MTVQVRLLRAQKEEMERKVNAIERVNTFVERAESLGLVKNKWAVYNVDLQEKLNNADMEQVVAQCANTDAYYFKPRLLQITYGGTTDAGGPGNSASGASASLPEGTLALKLRGAFWAKGGS